MDSLAMTGGAARPRHGVEPVELVDEAMMFEDFYRRQRLDVARALALTIGERELASEATDEAMIRAYQRWGKVSRLDNPGGWVYRVGLNWARSTVRKRGRRRPNDVPAHLEPPTAFEPSVVRALNGLSVDHRAVVVCRFLLGWSEHETARALGIRSGTAKSRTARALAQLRTELHHLAPEEAR